MTELLLVRHGETDSNRSRRYQGHLDTHLNDAGREQSTRLAARLRGAPVAALYTSDLARAVETAGILGHALGLTPIARTDLRELDVGAAVGKRREELRGDYPALFGDAWARTAFPGGESYEQMRDRLATATRAIIQRHPGQTIVVITHGGAIRAVISALTGMPLERLIGLVVANTSVTRLISADGVRAQLETVNDVSHLDPVAAVLPCEPW